VQAAHAAAAQSRSPLVEPNRIHSSTKTPPVRPPAVAPRLILGRSRRLASSLSGVRTNAQHDAESTMSASSRSTYWRKVVSWSGARTESARTGNAIAHDANAPRATEPALVRRIARATPSETMAASRLAATEATGMRSGGL
jgi:hypothetical protein